MPNSWFSPAELAGWGVFGVFFFYGLKLTPAKLRAGLGNIKLHIVVQLATFLLFPLLILGAIFVTGDWKSNYYLWLGIYFVATLPSTVSSSVVMVSIAKGNVPAAIFNASISSLIGIFLTPMLMSFVMSAGNDLHSFGHIVIKLLIQVVLPVGAGMLLNRLWGAFADRNKKILRIFDQGVILAIIYTAFCQGFSDKIFDTVSIGELAILLVAMTALFFAAYYIILFICKIMKFSREDTITATYCGSKKSLVHATVMSRVLFADPATVSIIILPTMVYHALQLMIVSVMAGREGK